MQKAESLAPPSAGRGLLCLTYYIRLKNATAPAPFIKSQPLDLSIKSKPGIGHTGNGLHKNEVFFYNNAFLRYGSFAKLQVMSICLIVLRKRLSNAGNDSVLACGRSTKHTILIFEGRRRIMRKQLVHLISFILVFGLVQTSVGQAADPNLVGWWKFDGDALDSSGHGRHGTLLDDAHFVPGLFDQALELDGRGSDCVNVDGYRGIPARHAFSVCAWVRPSGGRGPIVSWGDFKVYTFGFWIKEDGKIGQKLLGGQMNCNTDVSSDGEWHHIAMTMKENATVSYPDITFYVDGQDDTIPSTRDNVVDWPLVKDVRIGYDYRFLGQYGGQMDDVRIYDRELTAAEVEALALRLKAWKPDPTDGTENLLAPVTLQWTSGGTAAFHDVYVGTDPTLGSADLVSERQPADTYYLPSLDPATTYYWRIDEVELDGTTKYIGNVWNFSTPPLIAHSPKPADGASLVELDADLTWGAGMTAVTHDVYFGTDEGAVAAGTGGTLQGNQAETTYDPGMLVENTTYYCRIDEVEIDGTTKHIGDVWQFTTRPEITATDPSLMGWWKLDEEGSIALDWSGNGNRGTLMGDPQWVPGYAGGALEFDGVDDYVDIDYAADLTVWTVCAWVKSGDEPTRYSQSSVVQRGDNYQIIWDDIVPEEQGAASFRGDDYYYASYGQLEGNRWYCLAATYDGDALRAYRNGVLVSTNMAASGTPRSESDTLKLALDSMYFRGTIDDVRIYNRALMQEEIAEAMRADPMRAWSPKPANGAVTDVEKALPLSWSPGDSAAQHDVYCGTDESAVEDADASDTTGIYRGRQNPNTYTPAEDVEAGQTYYWRIDEVNADTTISKGRTWSFTVGESLIVDDFEDYDDYCNRVFYTWTDGFGHSGDPCCAIAPAPGNDTGSTVGHKMAPFDERRTFHGGEQCIPFAFDNSEEPFYSETSREWAEPQDWARGGVGALTLWLKARDPATPSSFTFDPASGIYTMTARCAEDIDDQFHFAYKRLNGAGSITANVLSVKGTQPNWNPAAVMIRETLDPDSPTIWVYVTAAKGIGFKYRADAGSSLSTGASNTKIEAPPEWIRLERLDDGTFKAYHSADGSDWAQLGDAVSIAMPDDVYIGFALSSRNPDEICPAEFSDVAMTGTITGDWQSEDVGQRYNSPGQLYVTLQDSDNNSATVKHPDPAVTTIADAWYEWNIDLTKFTGVNMQSIKKMSIGVGDKADPQEGGSGGLHIDDIRLSQGECLPSTYSTYNDWVALGKPDCWCSAYQCDGDIDGATSGFPFNYRIYNNDLSILVDNWQKKIDDPTLDPCADIDHKSSGFPFNYRVYNNDLSILVDNWTKKDSDLAGDCPRPE